MVVAWPHQNSGVNAVLRAIGRGERRICLTSPTGGGKTLMMCLLIREYIEAGLPVILYTNRLALIEQLSKVLRDYGFDHGVRAAGQSDEREKLLQISSIQTEHQRVNKRGTWKLHEAKLVIVDEAHIQTGATVIKILDQHFEAGAVILGVTATPLGIGHIYTHLIVAGKNSELRECGALLPCIHYGPDEPDFREFKKLQLGQDPTEKQNRTAIMTPGIMGRVWKSFCETNPDKRPTILFSPGVAESIWFAEQFVKKGVPAAHIDGQEVWINGKVERTSKDARRNVIAMSRSGEITVICNRFVLREGIDAPWLSHCILATVYGSLQSYLQSGGRLLRAFPGLEAVTLQDHGGNWWRHGSLNADREWDLTRDAHIEAGMRDDCLRTKKCRRCGGSLKSGSPFCPHCAYCNDIEPSRCPECTRIINGLRCACGYVRDLKGKKSRPVVSTDGTLKELTGDIFKPHRIYQRADGMKKWESMYWRSKTEKGARTFKAAMALFAYENFWSYPDRSWPFMPKNPLHFYWLVEKVPMDQLIPKE